MSYDSQRILMYEHAFFRLHSHLHFPSLELLRVVLGWLQLDALYLMSHCPSSHLKSHPYDCPTIACGCPLFFYLNFLTLNRTLVLSYWLCNHPTSLYHIPQVAIDTMFCPLYLTNLSIYHVYTPYCPVSDPRQMGQALESWICSRFLPICISNSREFFLSPVTHGLSLNV